MPFIANSYFSTFNIALKTRPNRSCKNEKAKKQKRRKKKKKDDHGGGGDDDGDCVWVKKG